jgi:transcriptional regulator with XRE-family HTH domain
MTEKRNILFSYSNSDETILKNMGGQLKQMRLNKNLTQNQLSDLSGLSRSAVSDLENRGNGSMHSFVLLLRTLEKLEILNHFISEAAISPIQISKMKGKIRKRASSVFKDELKIDDSTW